MANTEQSKKSAAIEAVKCVPEGNTIGLGTGSTVNYFIEELAKSRKNVTCVASSLATEALAKKLKLKLTTLNEQPRLTLYVDGADEVDKNWNLIKGAGGALTREKILASASRDFVVIVDEGKMVKNLGGVVPVEVIPFAQAFVENELREITAEPVLRPKFTTDNGNIILDVKNLDLSDPLDLEGLLNNIPGVVENGIFAMRIPDKVIIGKGKEADVLGGD